MAGPDGWEKGIWWIRYSRSCCGSVIVCAIGCRLTLIRLPSIMIQCNEIIRSSKPCLYPEIDFQHHGFADLEGNLPGIRTRSGIKDCGTFAPELFNNP